MLNGKISKLSALSLGLGMAVALSGCGGAPVKKDLPATGVVLSVELKEVTNDAGEVNVVAERLEELAERSVTDKGAESLLTAQRYVTIGDPFSSYSVGPEDKIVATIFNQVSNTSDPDSKNRRIDGSDIWVFSRGKTRITKSNYFNHSPSFSSNGKYIYFSSERGRRNAGIYDQNSYIWRMPATGGGGITRIGTPVYSYQAPIESPDGSKLLYTAREFMENSPFIWYSSNNGALPTQLTQGEGAMWVGDNKFIFSAKDENTGLYTIWTANIDGTELTQIISDVELDCIYPVVDPTNSRIAYVKQKPGPKPKVWESRDVYIYDMKSGLSQQVTTNISRDDMPRWSNDGKSLFFRSTRGLAWNIWKISTENL